jgi:hypothetical protein
MDYSCQLYEDEAVIHGTKYGVREMDDYYPWNCSTRSTVDFAGGCMCICIYLLYSDRSIQTEYIYCMYNTANKCKILHHIMLVYKAYKYLQIKLASYNVCTIFIAILMKV